MRGPRPAHFPRRTTTPWRPHLRGLLRLQDASTPALSLLLTDSARADRHAALSSARPRHSDVFISGAPIYLSRPPPRASTRQAQRTYDRKGAGAPRERRALTALPLCSATPRATRRTRRSAFATSPPRAKCRELRLCPRWCAKGHEVGGWKIKDLAIATSARRSHVLRSCAARRLLRPTRESERVRERERGGGAAEFSKIRCASPRLAFSHGGRSFSR
jgi:hypothetical protein